MQTNDADRQESYEHSHTTELHVPDDDAVILADGGEPSASQRPRDHMDDVDKLPTDREVALEALEKLVKREHITVDTELRRLRTALKDTRDGRQVPDAHHVEEVAAILGDLQKTLEENLHPIAVREE